MHRKVAPLVVAIGLLLAACGAQVSQSSTADDPTASGSPGTNTGSVLNQVRERGTLRAGVPQDSPPFGMTDESGNLVGFEADIVQELADALGVELELVPVSSDTRIPLITQGRIDLAASTLSHYWERDEVVDYTIGYFFGVQVVMVDRDSGITALTDLAGERVGAAAGAGTLEELPKVVPGVEMESFENYQDAFLAMQQGAIAGVATDLPVLAGLRNQSDNPDQWVFLEEPYGGSEFGIGVIENDSDWRDFINVELQKMWVDGRWDAIFDRWLGSESELQLTKEQLNWEMTLWAIPPR